MPEFFAELMYLLCQKLEFVMLIVSNATLSLHLGKNKHWNGAVVKTRQIQIALLGGNMNIVVCFSDLL